MNINKTLNLGFCINLPLNINNNMPEYDVDNINVIKKLSNKFNSIQIMFSKNNIKTDDFKNIKKITCLFKNVYIHASYQINIGAELIPTQENLYNISFDLLINEIIYSNKINAKGIVLHIGKNVKNKYDSDIIYNNMVKFIIELFRKLKNKKIKINLLLETPAGQGGEMCYNLNEFIEFIQRFKDQYFYDQLNICIDTCHIFQAGYDLNNNNIIKELHELFKPVFNKIKLIHLNDSYNPVGKHIDRHEQLGKGYIEINKLIKFIYPYIKIPFILETKYPYNEQLKLLHFNKNN